MTPKFMPLSAVLWAALTPAAVLANPFGIDFDWGPAIVPGTPSTYTTQPSFRSSFENFPATHAAFTPATSFNISNTYPNAFGPGKTFSYQINGSRRQDRGTLSGPFAGQSDLLRDYWGTRGVVGFGNPPNPVPLLLNLTMPSGEYSLTTFHHDEVSATPGTLVLTDALGPRAPLAIVESTGAAPLSITEYSTIITSDGTTPVSLVFNAGAEFGINGFLLEPVAAVPEPSTRLLWLCAAIVVIGVALCARRHG